MRTKNPLTQALISELKQLALAQKAPVWKRVAVELERPTRNRRSVNVYKIDLHAKDKDTIIVPGKVLGSGNLTKSVTVAAFNFSDEARDKINKSGKAVLLNEFIKTNPQGKKVRILG